MFLAKSVLEWAKETKQPGVPLASFWHRLAHDEKEKLKDVLFERSDWRRLTDRWGRPALWCAAARHPTLWREVTERRDPASLLNQRDFDGRGVWFYLFAQSGDRTFTKKLMDALRRRAPPYDWAPDLQGRGLFAQWLMDLPRTRARIGRWFPDLKHSSAAAAREWLKHVSAWPEHLLWASSEEDRAQMARSLLLHSDASCLHAVDWMAKQFCGRDFSSSRNQTATWSSEWLDEMGPELRCSFLLTAVLHSLSAHQFIPAQPLSGFMEALETRGVQWPSGVQAEAWLKTLDGLLNMVRKASGAKPPLMESEAARWKERVLAMSSAANLGFALENQGTLPAKSGTRARM